MSYWNELVADVERRFAKILRDQDVLDAVPVTELSDAELAHQVAKTAAAPPPGLAWPVFDHAAEPVAEDSSV